MAKRIHGVVDRPRGTPLWYEIRYGTLPDWFHWGISRKTSEDLLISKPVGHFLIRISESRVGYTLTYRGRDRCMHFVIEVSADGRYFILGEKARHRTLQDLVNFHRVTPVTPYGEVLTTACTQSPAMWNDPALVLFLEKQPGLSFLAPPNNHPSAPPRETANLLTSSASPAPPVVQSVPELWKKYTNHPPAHLPKPPSTSFPPFSIQETRGSEQSRRQVHTELAPEQFRRWQCDDEVKFLQLLFQTLDLYLPDVGKTLPEEYATPPPFSPDFKKK